MKLMAEGISLQWLTNLIWSVCSRNLPFTDRDPLFIVLGSLMYYIFTGIVAHLRFIALTSEMISLFLISLLLIVCYSSQLQPASFKCWAPKPSTGASRSSSQHPASSFSYLRKIVIASLLRNYSFSYSLFWRKKGRNYVLCTQSVSGMRYERKQDITCAVSGIEWVVNMTFELRGTSEVPCLLLRLPCRATSHPGTRFQEKKPGGILSWTTRYCHEAVGNGKTS